MVWSGRPLNVMFIHNHEEKFTYKALPVLFVLYQLNNSDLRKLLLNYHEQLITPPK